MKGLNKTGIYITHSYMLFRHYSGKNYTNTQKANTDKNERHAGENI